MPQVKAVPAQVKAADEGEPDGTFSAIVAAYNTDSGGDRIVPGAFQKSLDRWAESGNPIPIVWAHQHTDAFAHIGGISEAAETDDGLVVKGVLDIEDNPTAKQVYRLIKGGRINNYSFAYDVNDSEQAKSDDESGAKVLLKELEIFEAGPCLVGMNRDTRTLAVKSGEPGKKTVPGSFEARQDAIWAALEDANSSGTSWAFPKATFDDSVVYEVSGANGGTFQAPYTVDADGKVTLGEPTPVQVTETVTAVTPKSALLGLKVGKELSAANLAAIRKALQSIQDGVESLESITGVVDDDDAQESGKAHAGEPVKSDEDPTAKAEAEEPDGKSEDTHAPEPADPVLKSQSELSEIELEFLTI